MCYRCGLPLEAGSKPGFNETCPRCGSDLHVCKMCKFFNQSLHWECAETIESRVQDKDSRNFCDWFEAAPKFYGAGAAEADRGMAEKEKRARIDFEGLFKS